MQLSQDECECAEPVRGGVRDADTPPPQVGGDPRQPDPTGACPALGAGAMVGPAQGEPPPAEEPGGVSAPPLDLVSRGNVYHPWHSGLDLRDTPRQGSVWTRGSVGRHRALL